MVQTLLDVLQQGQTLTRLWEGLQTTLSISLISSLLSILLGVPIGFLMFGGKPVVRLCMKVYLEAVRFVPQIVLLFVIFFWLGNVLPIKLDAFSSALIVFTMWGAAEMGDLVRGAMLSIPKHQYDSSKALGMNTYQTFAYVVLPQAIQRLLPHTINLITRILKTSSIVVLIGVTEITKVTHQIIDLNRFEYPHLAIWMYGLLMLVYYLICQFLTVLAERLEHRNT